MKFIWINTNKLEGSNISVLVIYKVVHGKSGTINSHKDQIKKIKQKRVTITYI